MFSVVIPAYNCEDTIEKVLLSVFNQTKKDLIEEVIIINDGSSDNTLDVIRTFASCHLELPVLLFNQDNHGASYARNKGIRIAKAEWIALLDSDDCWRPNKLERQSEIITETEGICFLGSEYPVKIFHGNREGLVKLSAKDLCIRSMPTTPSVVFKKNVGIELGLFDENMHYCEDINFFQKFLLKDSYYVLAEPLVDIDAGKAFHAQTGLSSNLLKMSRGRDRNTREIYKMGLISFPFYALMVVMNQLKLMRRMIIQFSKLANIRQLLLTTDLERK